MKLNHVALGLALLAIIPVPEIFAARPAVTPALIQAGQTALSSGNASALRDLFYANGGIYLQLATALVDANKNAATVIATAAAQAFPSQATSIAAALANKVPDQRAAVYNAVGLTPPAPASEGSFPVFPVTTIDPVIVSPSS